MRIFRCLILSLLELVLSATAITSPPQIVRQPPQGELLFQVALSSEQGETPFIIECEAKGQPLPQYTWYKNGELFQWTVYSNRISQQPDRGTLVITSPRDEDTGLYQCFASNKFGTAVSNSVLVRKSELGSFKNQPPISISANEGDRLRLDCVPPEGYPAPTVYWMVLSDNGGLRSINSSRMTVDPAGTLWFSNVTLEDASDDFVYACSATSPFKTEYKVGNRVRLSVIARRGSRGPNRRPPVVQYVTPRSVTALRGDKLKLSCIYGGSPLPQVQWQQFDGQLQLGDGRVGLEDFGKSLVIERIDFDDEGEYVCTSANGVGQAKTETISVTLEAVPYFTMRPKMQMAAEGESVAFECEANGVPAPVVSWTVNGRPLSEADDNPRRTVANTALYIRDLLDTDTANYGCNATNRLGYAYSDVYVNVLALPSEIIKRPQDMAAVVGRQVVLECEAFGAPKPVVTWLRADSSVDVTSRPLQMGSKFKTDANNSLIISEIDFSDSGTYVCWASNKLGNDTANSTLIVKERTRISDAPESQRVVAGSSATFRCRAVSDPTLDARISWQADGWPIDLQVDTRFVLTSDNSLTITRASVGDTMNYTCVATTFLDRVTASATLVVEDVPNAPTLVRVTCREYVADVEWRDNGDNGAAISFYTIQLNTSFSGDSWEDEAAAPHPASSFTVSLSPWANYTFRVVAQNRVGPSSPSQHSTVCTTSAAPPGKNPDNVAGRGTSPDNLVIKWKPMPKIDHNGEEFQYRVSWRPDRDGSEWQERVVKDWRQDSLLVADQPTYRPYRVRVQAVNKQGNSTATPEDIRGWSGEDVPTDKPLDFNITQIMDGKRAVFAWSPVDEESLRGAFKGYKIETWTSDEGKTKAREMVFQSSATKGLVDHLKPFSVNHAQIRVFNGAYNGPGSDVITFQMPEGVPSAVDSLEAVALGSSSFYLMWREPSEHNGLLTGYRVRYQLMDGVRLGPPIERTPHIDDPLSTRTKLTALRPDTKYRLTVLATTAAGPGAAYYIERTTGDGEPQQPDPPSLLWSYIPPEEEEEKEELLGNSLQVTWVPNLQGHPGTHFYVDYRIQGSDEWTTTDPELETDSVILHGLDPAHLYEIRTVSVDGPFTQPSEIEEVIVNPDSGPAVEASAGHVATSGWFIGVMCAAALLLLLLALLCFMRRNRAGKYDVYDREVAHGRRDLTEEKGFQELHQPLDTTDSKNTIDSSTKLPLDSDSDSLGEYGDDAAGKFTEDGSFIGQYGSQKRKASTTNGVAYV